MHFKKLLNSVRKDTEDKVEKKKASLIGNIASIGSRLLSVLAYFRSVPSYIIILFQC